MVLAYMQTLVGKLNNVTELFRCVTARGDIAPGSISMILSREEQQASADGAEAAGGSSSSSSSSSAVPPRSLPKPSARTVDFAALHKKAQGTMEYVLELLASRFFRSIVIMIMLVTEPLAREHANLIVYLKGGAAKVRRVFGLMACGA